MNKPPVLYFKNLDGLRTICFLLVFLFHSFTTQSEKILGSDLYRILKLEGVKNGNLGVNAFFVLSGFLITYLLFKEKEDLGKISYPKFILRRVLRIWPLYFICVFIGFFIFPWLKQSFGEAPAETAHLVNYLTFTSNFDFIKYGRPDASILGVLWSISIEEQFYLVWPLVISLLPRKTIVPAFITLILCSILFRFFHQDYFHLEFHTLSCMSDLVTGALAAFFLFFYREQTIRFFEMSPWIIRLILLGLIALFFFQDELFASSSFYLVIGRIPFAILISGFILHQSIASGNSFELKNFRLLSNLGKYTYGMYCLHFLAILIIVTIIKKIIGIENQFSVFLLEPVFSLLLTILLSYLSYRIIEKPFLKLKRY